MKEEKRKEKRSKVKMQEGKGKESIRVSYLYSNLSLWGMGRNIRYVQRNILFSDFAIRF